MDITKNLTPKDTEEIKPGLFIQKRKNGKYKQIYPLAWEGKLRWKEQLKTIFTFRTFFTIALILFLAWSYIHDTGECRFIVENLDKFTKMDYYCDPLLEERGYCTPAFGQGSADTSEVDGGDSFILPVGS